MHFLAFTVAILYITGALCAPSDVSGCPRGAIYPHPTECGKYIACDHGKTHERTCPAGLLFDPVVLICNHAVNVQCGQEKCKIPDKPEHGDVKCSEGNGECEFACESDYRIIGNTRIICHDGRWSDNAPTCIKKCKTPDKMEHGGVKCSGGDEECEFTCETEYRIIGNTKIICHNGEWSDKAPTCIKKCKTFDKPEHGDVKCSDGNGECEFACESDYRIIGNPKIICRDGEWADKAPTCSKVEEKPTEDKEIPDKKVCLSARGQFSHPTDCNKYYNCWDGHIVITRCPAGTAFDATKNYCEASALTDCATNRIHYHPNSVTSVESEEKKLSSGKKPKQSSELPDSRYCLKARGQFPHPTDCKKYYDCWDSTILIRSCPEGTLFDAIKIHCGFSDTVTCNGHEKPTEDKEIPDKKFCLSARGQFPHPTDCSKYYNCWDGHIVISNCPAGTGFDATKHLCVESSLANCATKRIPYHAISENSGNAGCPRGPIYPHESDCHQYITCGHGSTHVQKCSPGLLFDPVALICNHAGNVQCKKVPEENKPDTDKKPEEPKEIPNRKYCLSARGQFPHPTDCKKYYDCWDSTVLIQTCPEGTLFDAKKIHCDFADSVTCNVHELEEKPTDEKEKPIDVNEIPDQRFCLSSRGQFPHPTDCKKYYNCWDGQIVITRCPTGKAFDATKRYCVESALAYCKVKRIHYRASNGHQRIALSLSLQRTVQELDDFDDEKYIKGVHIFGHKCPASRGQFAHESSCKMFYNCWDEVVVLQRCPNGLLFDPVKLICDSPDRVNCNGKINPKNEDKINPKIEEKDFDDEKYIKGVRIFGHKCPASRGQFGHESSCKMFYNCWDEVILLQKCPNGLLFDPVKLICDSPDRVNCNGKINPNNEDRINSKIEDKDFDDEKYIKGVRIFGHKCPATRGQFGHESSCKMFYNCWDEVVLLQRCPNGLLFDPVKLICDSPDRVNCHGKINPGIEDKKDVPKVKCNVNEGLMPNPKDCRTFYICFAGLGSEFTCPANLLFDVKTMACGYPEDAKCAGSISDGGNQQKEKPDSKIDLSIVGFKCEGLADGLYESNECHIFIKCVAGRSYSYLCPANLVYDTRTKRCDYAQNVARSCNNKV